jgi:membrane associated rhomboid family serine protease
LLRALRIAVVLSTVVALLHLFASTQGWPVGQFGVQPRTWAGLAGILTMPLLHGSWEHLFSNLPPLLLMTTALFWLFPTVALRVLVVSWCLPAAFVWLFAAAGGSHIGASGLTFALFAFLAFSGLVRRQAPALAVSLLTLFYYGGMLTGLLPDSPGISWQGHLAGFAVGLVLAWWYRHYDKPPTRVYDWELEEDEGVAFASSNREIESSGLSGGMPDSGHKH